MDVGVVEPLIGRAEELRVLHGALERGGCVISGAAGVGKSRLAAEAAARCEGAVVQVIATAAGATVPFGAVGHLLAGAQADERGPIAACLDRLREVSGTEPPTLLVDDGHLLDPASAALLLAARQSDAARVLVTVRSGERVPDAITSLWKERWVDRLDIGPLSRGELRRLVELRLGARADASVHASIASLTEGNPLYVRELLLDAQRSGALVCAGGQWQWSGTPPEWSRLRDLVAARVRDLSQEGRLAVELLAVGAPLPLRVLAALGGGDDGVAELERARLAVVRGAPESAEVDFAHPVFGEVTLASMAAATARSHRRRLAAELVRGDLSTSPELLRLARLKLEAGDVDPPLFLRAGAHALQIQAGVPGGGWGDGDAALAVRLADSAGAGLEAALLGARARIALSRFDEVEERLAPLEDEASRAPFEQAVEYLRARVHSLRWGSDTTADALALLDRAKAWRDERNWHAVRANLTAWVLIDCCRAARAVEVVEAVPDGEDLLPAVRLNRLVVLALAQSRLGLTAACETLEPEIERLADEFERMGGETGWARHTVDGLVRAEAARDLPGVTERLRAARARADARGDAALSAALAMVLGRLALLRGHAGEAITLLEEAAAGLASGDPRNALAWAFTCLTRAYAVTGDSQGARDSLARLDAVAAERPDYRRMQLEVERVLAWVDVAEGRAATARERLLSAAGAAGEALAFEGEALYDALRFGAPAAVCAPRLAELAQQAQSDLLDACAAHAAALATSDADAQIVAAKRFGELGLDLFASEAAQGAARAFAVAGRESSLRHASALAARYAAQCPLARTPGLTPSMASLRLTPREHEIALLAVAGRSNAEIAADVVLSVRTVETYVLRACRKLGVSTRKELAQVLTVAAEA